MSRFPEFNWKYLKKTFILNRLPSVTFMKVSIITVCLNAEKYLQNCIDSVRSQTYEDIEYIVVDGKSQDRTLEIINRNQDIIHKFISETDRGIYDAINKGMRIATGDIVGILNSDDVFATAGAVKSIVNCFHKHNTDVVYGDLVYISPQDENMVTRVWKGKPYKRYRFRMGWMPAHPTFYIKRHLVQKHGFYENHFYTAADYEFMARYLYKHRCSATYLEAIIVKMRSGGMSNGNLKRRLRANRRDYLAMKRNHIPFSFIVSIIKPLSKLHQYKTSLIAQAKANLKKPTRVVYLNTDTSAENRANILP